VYALGAEALHETVKFRYGPGAHFVGTQLPVAALESVVFSGFGVKAKIGWSYH
jgi:hypothetical protein